MIAVFAQACGGGQADPRTDALNDAAAQDIPHDLPPTDGFADSPDPGDLLGEAPGDIDATSDVAPPDVSANCPGEPLCPCDDNGDCFSGLCLETMNGRLCSAGCSSADTCPRGWRCEAVATTPDVVYGCVAPSRLCRPCLTNADCAWQGQGEDVCISHGATGSFCGVGCVEDNDCVNGFVCADVTATSRTAAKQCMPAGEAPCPCTAWFAEQAFLTDCFTQNPDLPDRQCKGTRTCDVPCPAPMPIPEDCNGLDEDCNGLTDDGMAAPEANRHVGVCADAVKVCAGNAGWMEPIYSDIASFESTEVTCDGHDNDCDGDTDENMNNPIADVQFGICAGATKVCNGPGGGWVEPDYAQRPYYESPETACDGRDNDCDSVVDTDPEVAASAPTADRQNGVCAASRKRWAKRAWKPPWPPSPRTKPRCSARVRTCFTI